MPRPGERPILLVEDNPDDEELALLALRQAGLADPVDVVRDGEEAVDYLLGEDPEPRVLPFLVLLDLSLPKMDGFEVLQRIRRSARTRVLPTVVLTSSDVPEDVARAYALGANSYVRKPVEYGLYAEHLQNLGQYWSRINLSPPGS